MSDVHDFEDEAQEQTGKNPVRARMKELESEVKALREKAAEAEKLQKELAFSKAGIPMDAPMAKYFIKGYEGEFTPEAIRKAAEEANLLQAQAQAAPQQEQQAWSRMQKASTAGDTSEPVVDWNQRINQAKNADEVMQLLAQARQEAQNT
jgi:DNA-binding transcriptional regulator GbsR (MarR family)